MTAATVPGIDEAPTANARLLSWVREVAELTTPDRIVWCDGSDEEWERVTTSLVEAGTFVRLDGRSRTPSGPRPTPTTSRASRSAPTSARCWSPTPASPTTGWIRPR